MLDPARACPSAVPATSREGDAGRLPRVEHRGGGAAPRDQLARDLDPAPSGDGAAPARLDRRVERIRRRAPSGRSASHALRLGADRRRRQGRSAVAAVDRTREGPKDPGA
ncbi:hypothetical protein GCM10009869_29820 [Amnibacterium kyonggiense]